MNEQPIKKSTVSAYLIICDKIEYETFPIECLAVNEAGYYYVDNYGMGACHWSIISHPKEAFSRQLKDNVLWAKDRLKWAKDNAKKEIPKLKEIIDSNGYARLLDRLNIFRAIRDQFPESED